MQCNTFSFFHQTCFTAMKEKKNLRISSRFPMLIFAVYAQGEFKIWDLRSENRTKEHSFWFFLRAQISDLRSRFFFKFLACPCTGKSKIKSLSKSQRKVTRFFIKKFHLFYYENKKFKRPSDLFFFVCRQTWISISFNFFICIVK